MSDSLSERFFTQYIECSDMGPEGNCSGPFHVVDKWLGRIIGFETSGEARGCIEDWEEDERIPVGKS